MMTLFHFSKEGRAIDWRTWAELFEDREYRRVAKDVVDGVEVSTVWLGISGQVFETMIFGGPHDGRARRYQTLDLATKGHAAVVRNLVFGLDPITGEG